MAHQVYKLNYFSVFTNFNENSIFQLKYLIEYQTVVQTGINELKVNQLKVQLDNERKKSNNARERGRIRYINDEFEHLQKIMKPWLNGYAPKVRRDL